MDKDLAQQAVSAALKGDWKAAIEINSSILKKYPQDIDSLNRLARAYAEVGNLTSARKTLKRVLAIDSVNSIAKRAWEKWRGLKKGDCISTPPTNADLFIEIPGKTKIIPLINLGDAKILAKLDSGDEVRLNPYGHRVNITTNNGKYIGRLPDDIGAKIKKLIKLGSAYKVVIKCCKSKDVRIFIKEIASSKKGCSFAMEKIDYVAFTPPELVHKKNDLVEMEEEQ